MFCPKCGTKNPGNGKFCRSCGTDLSPVSDALSGNFNNGKLGRKNPFEMTMPRLDPLQLRDKKGKPVHWESAMTKLFSGIAFVIVTIVLAFSAMGNGWWFWMLIPAFSCLGAGVAQIIQLKSAGKQGLLPSSNVSERGHFSSPKDIPADRSGSEWIKDLVQSGNKILAIKIYRETYGVGLKEAKEAVERTADGQALPRYQSEIMEEYTKPTHSIYDTGDLAAPSSVTENTTRHLEINSEGETMTLPKKD